MNSGRSYVYMLQCSNEQVNEVYIGSTKDYVRRFRKHRTNCYDKNDRKYDYKLYSFIRSNGGFDEWDIVILEECECSTKMELFQKEKHWIELLKPSLNCKQPCITDEERKEWRRQHRSKSS